jgi:hypothetical protein
VVDFSPAGSNKRLDCKRQRSKNLFGWGLATFGYLSCWMTLRAAMFTGRILFLNIEAEEHR